jgi:hypothetical protein
MKGWKQSLLWEGLPLSQLVFVFTVISIINWEYQRKFFEPVEGAPDWMSVHFGWVLLALALGMAGLASVILLVIRVLSPGIISSSMMLIPLTLVQILLVFPSLFLVVLGPAYITMSEQIHSAQK